MGLQSVAANATHCQAGHHKIIGGLIGKLAQYMPKPRMALMNWNPKRMPKKMRIIVKIFVGMFRISLIANNMINGSKQAYNGPSTGKIESE